MFETLSEKLENAFRAIQGRKLTPDDIRKAMQTVRGALLEADVNFEVAREFVRDIEEEAVGEQILSGLNPGQQVVKVVNDKLIEMLGGESTGLTINKGGLTVIMMVGLQGSGKTTHVAKLARLLRQQKHRPLLVAADIYRPAAIAQLETLGKQNNIPVFSEGTTPPPLIAQHALAEARKNGNDVVIIDTAGRLQIDEPLMQELAEVKAIANPTEILLIVDAMTGQESVNVASEFNRRVGITGIIMTKMDGDARGGAALSVRAVTGVPIKFIGTGEKVDAIEQFYPDRIASRILGMGDILTLIEKAQAEYDEKQAAELQAKLKKGSFDLEDFLQQMRKMRNMGPLGSLLGLMPGGMGRQMKEMRAALETPEAEKELKRTEAIILSMTPDERHKPEIIDASRRRRIARGSGTQVSDVNSLLNQFRQMRDMMRQMGRGGGIDPTAMLNGGGGMPGGGGPRKPPPPRAVDPLAQFKGGRPGSSGGGGGRPGGNNNGKKKKK